MSCCGRIIIWGSATVSAKTSSLVRDRQDRPLACLSFGSAAWQYQPRDAFPGWSSAQRQRHRSRLTNNTRFLILPWVRIEHGGETERAL